MNIDIGFLMAPDTLRLLQEKSRRLVAAAISGSRNIAMLGSEVTVIDCLDSQIHQFRLVGCGTTPEELPVDSALGLALLGSKAGDVISISLGGDEGRTVVLRIDNK